MTALIIFHFIFIIAIIVIIYKHIYKTNTTDTFIYPNDIVSDWNKIHKEQLKHINNYRTIDSNKPKSAKYKSVEEIMDKFYDDIQDDFV